MAIVNLRDSLDHALSEMFEFWRYDAWIIVDDQIPIERLVNEAESVQGVTNAEGWGFTVARYVRPDDTEVSLGLANVLGLVCARVTPTRLLSVLACSPTNLLCTLVVR